MRGLRTGRHCVFDVHVHLHSSRSIARASSTPARSKSFGASSRTCAPTSRPSWSSSMGSTTTSTYWCTTRPRSACRSWSTASRASRRDSSVRASMTGSSGRWGTPRACGPRATSRARAEAPLWKSSSSISTRSARLCSASRCVFPPPPEGRGIQTRGFGDFLILCV